MAADRLRDRSLAIKRLNRKSKFAGVYFLQGERTLHIKIGFSQNVVKRAAYLATASSETLKFLGAIAGTRADEQKIQAQFAEFRLRGEWFQAHQDLCDFICARTTIQPVADKWSFPEV